MSELIRVAKADSVMEVHPTALRQHLLLGWKLAPVILDDVVADTEEEVLAAAENFTKRGPGRPKKLPNAG